jgi:hypothetical protein
MSSSVEFSLISFDDDFDFGEMNNMTIDQIMKMTGPELNVIIANNKDKIHERKIAVRTMKEDVVASETQKK